MGFIRITALPGVGGLGQHGLAGLLLLSLAQAAIYRVLLLAKTRSRGGSGTET